jgi:biopolymer transport protein ExbB/TolQ
MLMGGGPFMWVILLIIGVILVLAVISIVRIFMPRSQTGGRTPWFISGVLLWGAVAAVCGFLGQWIGLFKSITAVAKLGVVNQQAVAMGLRDSLISTIFGMTVLLAAAILWFILHSTWQIVEGRRADA